MAWIGLRNSCRKGLHKDGRKWMAQECFEVEHLSFGLHSYRIESEIGLYKCTLKKYTEGLDNCFEPLRKSGTTP
jgi:hypothetical protein